MKIERRLVFHLEELSRIKLTAGSEDRVAAQLEKIISYVQQLQEVDTTSLPPAGVLSAAGDEAVRKDKKAPGLARDDVLSQAPDRAGSFFRVPMIIDRENGKEHQP